MAFLTRQELITVARAEKVTRIADNDDLIIQQAINTAITEVKSRLTPNNKKAWMDGRFRYDVNKIFSQTGDDRNDLILDITKVVALWWLILRNNPGVDYEVVAARYQFGIDYLKDLATGEANDGTLPLLQEPVDENGDPISTAKPFSTGSRKKFAHDY